MYLSTTPFLDRAIRLYERFGFQRSDEGPLDLFGTPLFTMTKRLNESYVLAMGEAAAMRLRLLDEIFGPDSRELLKTAGLRRGLHVAEIGCGSGLVAAWMAREAGPGGGGGGVGGKRGEVAVGAGAAGAEGAGELSFS